MLLCLSNIISEDTPFMKVSKAKSLPVSGVKELGLRRKAGGGDCECVVCFLVVFVVEKFGETEATRKSVKVLTEFYKVDCARCWTEVQVL